MATVLIESSARDATAAEVIAWLLHGGHTCLRIQEDDPLTALTLRLDRAQEAATLHFRSGLTVALKDVQACWHRQDALTFPAPAQAPEPLLHLLEADWMAVRRALYTHLRPTRRLGSPTQTSATPNLVQLLEAKALGIAIPPTLVATSRAALHDFLLEFPQAITKRLETLPQLSLDGTPWAAGGTRQLTLSELDTLDTHFFPALVQAQVAKAYELRIFYLRGQCFAQALLTARGREPLVDVRTPPSPDHLRRVPFGLPTGWTNRLHALMQRLGLDTGSVDAIVTPDDEFVFLEVNPVGQLDGVSKECNYHLEEHIARYLAGE